MTGSEMAAEDTELLSARVTVPDAVVYRSFAQETVVLNLETGLYHGLNPTAGLMLDALVDADSVGAAAEQVAVAHGWPLARVQRDLCTLCDALNERRLLTIERR